MRWERGYSPHATRGRSSRHSKTPVASSIPLPSQEPLTNNLQTASNQHHHQINEIKLMRTNIKTKMCFLVTLFKGLKCKTVLSRPSSLQAWRVPFPNTWNLVLFIIPVKEVHWLCHTTSCPNDSTSQEMSSLLGVQSDTWLPSPSSLKPQTERLFHFPILKRSQADRGISSSSIWYRNLHWAEWFGTARGWLVITGSGQMLQRKKN